MNGIFCWMSFTELAKLIILVLHFPYRTCTMALRKENWRPGACSNTCWKYLRGCSRTMWIRDQSKTPSIVSLHYWASVVFKVKTTISLNHWPSPLSTPPKTTESTGQRPTSTWLLSFHATKIASKSPTSCFVSKAAWSRCSNSKNRWRKRWLGRPTVSNSMSSNYNSVWQSRCKPTWPATCRKWCNPLQNSKRSSRYRC